MLEEALDDPVSKLFVIQPQPGLPSKMTTVLKIEFFSLKINYIHVSNSSTIFQGT
jgi:hypothetical protein